ncbi:ABC transporter ATP-binding protein [Paramicrobacterium agarici]|uniref:ABC transporter ATP-binding protein n=1 Tax=Paramicrobacterium agarici TaxID=630514 RepID=UPI00114FDF76|nr:ABC transporter ATP-binding protein [Microbacterium agarici]TQO23098.1 peptide/nickel transport system ATP-binding protein [Microbacterium agarici]
MSSHSHHGDTGRTSETPLLAARELTKHFPVKGPSRRVVHAVDGVDLDLHAGEVVALVGESGSGKSTVARLLAKLMPHTSGEVLLEGEPVTSRFGRRFRAYCRRVQMILQDPFASLNPIHRVRYVLTRSLSIHRGRMSRDERERMLFELLERVDLTPPERYLEKFPHELSGGQRQRVAIARALGADPEVLLADEPVSMLDVSIRIGVLNLLRDLKDRFNLAVLYITHDIASARYFADRTVVMYAGQIVERGPSEAVTQHPRHPYTQLLIASAPDADRLEELEKTEAQGEPPSLIAPPSGCRFNPRCPFAMERCRTEAPPMFAGDDGNEAACWLYADDAKAQREAAFGAKA